MFLNLFSARHLEIDASGDLNELREANIRILDTNPNDQDALFVVGSIYASQGKWREAIQFLERQAQLDPNDASLLNDLSICYWNHKDDDSCYKTLIRLLGLDSSSWFTYDMLCVVALRMGRSIEAVSYGEEAVRRGGSEYGESLNNLGCAYMDVRQYSKAAALFLRAIDLEGENVLFKENLTWAYISQDRLDDARAIIADLLARTGAGARTHYVSALYWECKGDLDEAIAELMACIDRDPGYVDALRILGRVFFKKNKLRESISSYIQAEARLARLDAQDYVMMGNVYSKNSSYTKAIEAYEKSIAISPSPETCCAIGNIYFEVRNFDKARASYSESLRLNPKYLDAQFGIASIYSQEENFPKALIEFRKCLRIQSGYPKAHRAIADIQLKLGHLQEALAEISISLRNNPEDSDALYLQGCVYARMGDADRAIHVLENCLQRTPCHKPALNLLVELRDLDMAK